MFKKHLILLSILLLVSTKIMAEKPNIIFIITDDQRYDMLGCTGNELIQTPNIDKLADDGVLFTNAHITSAICTPSRVSMFLSQFERKHGVNFNSGTSVSEEAWEKSYPVVLRENGYYTGYIGKNHAPVGHGGYESGYMEETFDYWYAGHRHLGFYPKRRHEIFKGAEHDTQVEILDEGVGDFLGNEHTLEGAKHFLEQRPEDKPFFMNVCFNVPHGAATRSMELLDSDSVIYRTLYRDKEIPLPENYVEYEDVKDPKLPESIHFADEIQTGYSYTKKEETVKETIIRQMQTVTGVDGLIGNLREYLKKNNLDKNTIIFFSSDHGLFMGEYGFGGKALCYEICTHVPMIVFNPYVKKRNRGKKIDELVQSIDIAPTMLEYAGLKIPATYQGKSLAGLLDGQEKPVRDFLFTENLWSTQFGNPRCESVQDKKWKYIRYYENNNLRASWKIKTARMMGMNVNKMLYAEHDPSMALYRSFVEKPLLGEKPVYEELYDLENDPLEENNLAGEDECQDVMKKMRKAWKEKIAYARGDGDPEVYRYTEESEVERKRLVKPE